MSTRTRWLTLAALLGLAVVVALTVPLPSPSTLRDEAASFGPWAPLGFLLLHALVTTTPLPRTAFTIAAGLLFGPALGVALCLVASTVSAALGFVLARRLGGRALVRLGPDRVQALEERISRRGFLTSLSTHLVPVIPFAPLNYAFGLTSIRLAPFVVGTAIGLIPGTTTVVLLGDATLGHPSPTMLLAFVVSGTVGLLGVTLAARERRTRPATEPATEAAT